MTDFELIAKGMQQVVPFVGHLGLEITSIEAGESEVVLPERHELTNHVGSQHAGALFGAAETASGAAFVGAFAERMGDIRPLARSAEIDYRRVAKGPITARGRLGIEPGEALAKLDGDGKVEFPVTVELNDGGGELVATATVRWHVSLNEAAT